jgi:hypothetical protein
MAPTLAEPTLELIRDGVIAESQGYEFKARVNLDEQREKSNFVTDVVAFLNAGPGHLIVGVHEKRGAFDRLEPVEGDKDAFRRRLMSIIQDNIDPKPLQVGMHFLDVDGGFLVVIALPEHRLRPYQNKITGAFYIRTGAQNTPIPRDQVHALFTSIEQFEADTLKLMERENEAVEARDIMQANGSTLHIAIVPQEYYQRDRAPFDPGRGELKVMQHFHDDIGHGGVFNGCENGVEVRDSNFDEGRSTSRFFIGDDWLVHSYVAHPLTIDASDRITLSEFRDSLARYMRNIQLLLDKADIRGAFSVLFALRNLRRSPKLRWGFPNADTATMPRPVRIERVDDPALIKRFCDKVSAVSIYGR